MQNTLYWTNSFIHYIKIQYPHSNCCWAGEYNICMRSDYFLIWAGAFDACLSLTRRETNLMSHCDVWGGVRRGESWLYLACMGLENNGSSILLITLTYILLWHRMSRGKRKSHTMSEFKVSETPTNQSWSVGKLMLELELDEGPRWVGERHVEVSNTSVSHLFQCVSNVPCQKLSVCFQSNPHEASSRKWIYNILWMLISGVPA